MPTILENNREHFKKYLPENVSWEEFDNIVFQTTKEIAVFKKLLSNGNNSVSKNDITSYLIKQGYDSDISYCVMLSMIKLTLDKRVIKFGHSIGLGTILPK